MLVLCVTILFIKFQLENIEFKLFFKNWTFLEIWTLKTCLTNDGWPDIQVSYQIFKKQKTNHCQKIAPIIFTNNILHLNLILSLIFDLQINLWCDENFFGKKKFLPKHYISTYIVLFCWPAFERLLFRGFFSFLYSVPPFVTLIFSEKERERERERCCCPSG